MIVAIDGPAGSGKSTIALLLSKKYNLFNLNSGEFYRAFAYAFLQKKRNVNDKNDIDKSLKDIKLSLKNENVCIDDKVVDKALLHTAEIDEASSILSANIPVRLRINELLRESTKNKDIVCEGRDITSVVFPNAEVKIYLDASLSERANRRGKERGEERESVSKELASRDKRDINKEFGALKIVKDAVVIDTTSLTINEVFNRIEKIVEKQLTRVN